jgi:hypothetical protein
MSMDPTRAGAGFYPVPVEALLKEYSGIIPWIWEPFLAEGTLNLLAAFMKTGKSTLASALAVAIAKGKPFLGFPVQKAGVLLLALEEHPRDVSRRFQAFGVEGGDELWVHTGSLWNSTENLDSLRTFILSVGIKLVIVDTLTKFWRVRDENSNAEIDREVSPLVELARQTGAAILLVHHERKAGGDEGRGIRGGSSLFASVDQALLLETRHGGNSKDRLLRAHGRYKETPSALFLTLEGTNYRLLGTADDFDPDGVDQRVLQVLARGPLTRNALTDELGLSYKVVAASLVRLELALKITRGGTGNKGDAYIYSLPTSDGGQGTQ